MLTIICDEGSILHANFIVFFRRYVLGDHMSHLDRNIYMSPHMHRILNRHLKYWGKYWWFKLDCLPLSIDLGTFTYFIFTFIIEYEYNKDIHAFMFMLSNKLYFSWLYTDWLKLHQPICVTLSLKFQPFHEKPEIFSHFMKWLSELVISRKG